MNPEYNQDMKTTITTQYETTSDGTTVWVCDNSGYTIGRFGKMGIDIHQPPENGGSECLHCTHGIVTREDWDVFVVKMLGHYGVIGLEHHCPTRFQGD